MGCTNEGRTFETLSTFLTIMFVIIFSHLAQVDKTSSILKVNSCEVRTLA